jgi:DtxR family Mn-dependent transcriptional regulator
MKGISGHELSPKKAEYLKYVAGCTGAARTTDAAAHFAVAPSTATKTLEDLARAGYLEHTPYRGFALTAKGEQYARFLIRRHRIVALMLSRFGLAPEEACSEARKMEGCVSREVVDRICRSLGHPRMSVCGRIEHDPGCCSSPEPSDG